MIPKIMFILIIGSVFCVLMGIALTAVRAVKLVRRDRALANKIWAYWQVEKARSHATEEEDIAPKCSDTQCAG